MGGEAVSVRVLARIRPINKNEEKKGEKSVVIFKGRLTKHPKPKHRKPEYLERRAIQKVLKNTEIDALFSLTKMMHEERFVKILFLECS